LETNNHLPLLQQDMRREIIYQMFYRLRATQVPLSLSSSNLPSLRSDL
jgi:hypothetical protein